MKLKSTVEHLVRENTEKRLKTIAQQGLNSKPFWNIVRQMKNEKKQQ